MRKVHFVTVFVLLVAVGAAAQTISSISPTSVPVARGEHFLTVNGTSLGDTVVFTGPTGTFSVAINARTTSGVVAWVPQDVSNVAAHYTVLVRGRAGDSNSVGFDVIGAGKLGLALYLPEAIAAQALTREGAYVKYDVVAAGGDDPSPVIDCSPASGSLFKLGVTSVRCIATNRYGEQAAGDFPVRTFDGAAPVVSVPRSFAVDASSSAGEFVKFDASATDDLDGALAAHCSPASGSLLPVGITTVVCTATDSSLNSGSSSFDVNVRWKALVIHVPDKVVAEAQTSKGSYVDFDVTATSPDDPDPVIKCDTKSGSFFALGSSIVTCTAYDRLGGQDSARFEVLVADTVGPVVASAVARPEWLAPTGDFVKVPISVDAFDVTDPMPRCSVTGVTGNELIDGDWEVVDTLTVALRAVHKNDVRVYAVGIRCTDVNGNASDGNATVTVSDKQPEQPLSTVSAAKKGKRE